MLIGIPKEIKNNENRVALTPAGVHSLVGHGHQVLVETQAGLGSGFMDEDYKNKGLLLSLQLMKFGKQSWSLRSKNRLLRSTHTCAKISCSSLTCTWLLHLN